MAKKLTSDTNFTLQVKALSNKIYSKSMLKDSILERAISFFAEQCVNQSQKDNGQSELVQLQQKIKKAANKEEIRLQKKITLVERDLRDLSERVTFDRDERNQHLLAICQEIIHLCEVEDIEECNKKSAQILGTIQLLSPVEGNKIAETNEQNKPLYKAVLCLRLLDRLCIDQDIIEPYISGYLTEITPEQYHDFSNINPEGYKRFVEQVKIPVVMAALLQDIGNYHPDAQKIMHGVDGKADPYRTLPIEERKALLQINYRETVTYLIEGIGGQKYIGNSKTERDKFNQNEKKKILFIKGLLKSSINPKQGYGNLLKVPQIYTSIILSTKSSYNYKLLPKVFQALNQNADRGNCSQVVVDALYKITGDFPQGFGIIYVPFDSSGKECDRYEYAIVNQLYPKAPNHPLCRSATRNLTFIGHGLDMEVAPTNNLYFSETAKRFSTMSKERLHEILELLSSNYQERKQLDILPRCWQAKEYFSVKNNQKLWIKSGG